MTSPLDDESAVSAELKALRLQNERLLNELAAAQAKADELQAVYASRSWRITRPLRITMLAAQQLIGSLFHSDGNRGTPPSPLPSPPKGRGNNSPSPLPSPTSGGGNNSPLARLRERGRGRGQTPHDGLLATLRRSAKSFLKRIILQVLANPTLKAYALKVLARHPQLKQHLRNIAASPFQQLAEPVLIPSSEALPIPSSESALEKNLSPRAASIFVELKQAIEARRN